MEKLTSQHLSAQDKQPSTSWAQSGTWIKSHQWPELCRVLLGTLKETGGGSGHGHKTPNLRSEVQYQLASNHPTVLNAKFSLWLVLLGCLIRLNSVTLDVYKILEIKIYWRQNWLQLGREFCRQGTMGKQRMPGREWQKGTLNQILGWTLEKRLGQRHGTYEGNNTSGNDDDDDHSGSTKHFHIIYLIKLARWLIEMRRYRHELVRINES